MSCFENSAFWTKSLNLKVNGEDLQYFYYSKPSLAYKSPLVILKDTMFDLEVMETLLTSLKDSFPIFFVTLPINVNNEQSDSSKLLKGFCDKVGIEKINLLGISYSGVTAYNFASKYPDYVKKLIVHGVSSNLKESTKRIITENINYLKNDQFEKFAASFSMNIMNFTRSEMINKGHKIHKEFYNKYRNIGQTQKELILNHFENILNNNKLEGRPICQTLVLAGQYDHFTTPYENFLVSKKCLNSQFGILKRVDHFASIEKSKMIVGIYNAFFSNESIKDFSGLDVYDDDFYPSTRRQIEPRYRWGSSVRANTEIGSELKVSIVDLNGQGCKLHIPKGLFPEEVTIDSIKLEVFPNCFMKVLLFKKGDDDTYHGVFQHQNIDDTYNFLNNFSDEIIGKSSFKAA